MSDFLPNDYDGIPQGPSNYLKLEEGENIIRILSSAIIGYEYWTGEGDSRKPIRVKDFDEVPDEYKNNKDNRNNAKYFWAFVVYNLKTKGIQILQIRQKGIMNGIEALNKSKSWGNPKLYNIIITKTKTGSEPRDVEYSVMPEPKEALDAGILKLYNDMDIDLTALYEGNDPFKSEDEVNPDEVDKAIG
jgi:hypothetical protein